MGCTHRRNSEGELIVSNHFLLTLGFIGAGLLGFALLLGVANLILCRSRWWTPGDAMALGGVQIAFAVVGAPLFGSILGLYLNGVLS